MLKFPEERLQLHHENKRTGYSAFEGSFWNIVESFRPSGLWTSQIRSSTSLIFICNGETCWTVIRPGVFSPTALSAERLLGTLIVGVEDCPVGLPTSEEKKFGVRLNLLQLEL